MDFIGLSEFHVTVSCDLGLKLLTFGESDEEGARTVCLGSNAVRGKIVRVPHTNRGLAGGWRQYSCTHIYWVAA